MHQSLEDAYVIFPPPKCNYVSTRFVKVASTLQDLLHYKLVVILPVAGGKERSGTGALQKIQLYSICII